MGVTLLAASTVPEGVRTLGEREGFPEMGVLDVCVHRNRENPSEAANCLADYIAGMTDRYAIREFEKLL
mgnify:CR=1 FL=1